MNYTENESGLRTWPRLFKTGSKGAEQQWDISVLGNDSGASIAVEHGQAGGKIQTAVTRITEGKNKGRKNETSPLQQACLEAQAKWLKQKDKGYSEERGGASMELKPMLAHKYEDCRGKVGFPAYLQPKLDGVRAVAVKKDYQVRLWSRQGKEFSGLAHIKETLSLLMDEGELFDGELYVHGMPFQSLISLVKKQQEASATVQYHVYDMVFDAPFEQRLWAINSRSYQHGPVRPVETISVSSHEEVEDLHRDFVEQGYEGVMLRVGDCTYKQGYRSRELLKVKAWQDAEFKVVDIVPGKGKMEDQAILVCETEQGVRFQAKPKGRDELRREYLARKEEFIGRYATVSFFEWTQSDPPVPRFPVALKIRDELE